MKKTILLLLAALCITTTVAAQDVIVKRDAAKIEAKVLEITSEAVRYKRFSNPEGPTYVLAADQIEYIQYANGEKEYFNAPEPVRESIPATPLTPATPASGTASYAPVAPPPSDDYVLRTYEIGDFYDRNGVKGVVCEVSDDKLHGTIISLEQIYLPWSEFRKPDLRVVGAGNRTEGQANMETVARYIADNDLTWDDFPAFKWCREMGDGWYLPAIDEMLRIGLNYNGGTRMQTNRKDRNKFNDSLREHGGKRMDRLVYYFSSTEMDDKNAYTTHMDLQPPYVVEIPKYNKFLVRAIRKF